MHTTLRPFATAGVALVGATAIAITPVAPTTLATDMRVASPAVQLTAAVDPITPWLEVFNNSEVNFANLVNTWLQAPAPVLQQVIANQIGYLSQLPDFPAIIEQMVANLGAAIHTPFAIDPSTLENTQNADKPLSHRSLWTILEALGADSPIPPELQPLINFSTTYTSGILLGLVGPVISPVLALAASVTAIVENLTGATPDLQAAFNTLINTPATMVDAFLNGGQSVDITPVLDAIGLSLNIPDLADMNSVGITFGGLLSPGGSIFNALSFDMLVAGSIPVNIPGNGPGFVGSIIGLTNAIAKAIGWDGVGNPLAPPLTTPETPETPDLKSPAAVPDVSMLASKTVALETSKPALAEKVAPVEEKSTSTEEATGETDSATTPVVSAPEEEPTDTVDETVDETVDDTTDEAADDAAAEAAADAAAEAADEAADDAADEAADDATDEAKSTKPGLNGSKPSKEAGKTSTTKTSQSSESSDNDSSKSSDNKSDD